MHGEAGCSRQGRLGAPEAARGLASQPGARRRDTGHPGRQRVAPTPNGRCRIESWVLPGDFPRRVEWLHKVSSYLHLFRWSQQVVTPVTPEFT
jgi:hypothetical protein